MVRRELRQLRIGGGADAGIPRQAGLHARLQFLQDALARRSARVLARQPNIQAEHVTGLKRTIEAEIKRVPGLWIGAENGDRLAMAPVCRGVAKLSAALYLHRRECTWKHRESAAEPELACFTVEHESIQFQR